MIESTMGVLVAKIIAAGIEAGFVEKSGRNTVQGYDFVSEADVVRKVGGALLKRGILVYPQHEIESVVPYATKSGSAAFLTTISTNWIFTDGQEQINVITVGQGTDTGGDKGVYKAMTGSKKYALLQALMIATGDDPEIARKGEESDEAPVRRTRSKPAASEDEAEEDVDPTKPTASQIGRLFALGKQAGLTEKGAVAAFVKKQTGKFSSKQLKRDEMEPLFAALQIMAAAGPGSEIDEPEVPSSGPD